MRLIMARRIIASLLPFTQPKRYKACEIRVEKSRILPRWAIEVVSEGV
jgi:hypothetical protein